MARELTDDAVHDRISYHPPSADGSNRHVRLAVDFESLMRTIDDVCPSGREKALAFTKLEEAKMWASAAVARNPETR